MKGIIYISDILKSGSKNEVTHMIKKFILFIIFIMLLQPLTATAYDAYIDGIYYNISPTEAEVTASVTDFTDGSNAKAYSGDVKIPSNVTFCGVTYSVKSISSSAFRDCNGLISVTIPSSVTSIGINAFYGCSMLTSVTIPNSVTSIGQNAFYGTAWFDSQPEGLIYVGEVLYKYKGMMPNNTSIVIKEGTVSIAGLAFYECTNLRAVNIPNSVISIGERAFAGCTNLTSVNIPYTVTSIGVGAFEFSQWYDTQPDGLVYAGQILYKYKGSLPNNTSITIKEGTKGIAESAFSGHSELTSIEIPNSVTNIDSYAFQGCSGLVSISIPSSITTIGSYAFMNCTNLISIEIPNGTVKIGGCSFAFCNNLTSIKISESVSSIGLLAFWGCSSLNSIIIDPKNPYYDSRENCNAIIQTGTNTLVAGCASTTIPPTVTSIKRHAFNGMSIKNITIPESVTSIGDNAFQNCQELREVVFFGNPQIKGLEEATFLGCSNLRSIKIPEGVLYIGYECFSHCEQLQSIYIPNSVDSIANSYGCYNLNRIYISSIDSWCKIRLSGAFLDYYLYLDNNLLTELVIPGYLSEIKYATFGNCLSLKTLSIEEGIKSIGSYSFGYCANLTSIILPKSLYYIDREAFCYWTSLTDIFCYAENVPTSGYDVFLESPIEKATLHVPASSLEAYKRTSPWSRFGNIVALTDDDPKPTDVNTLKEDNIVYPINTYTIEGGHLSYPQRGLNIIRMSDGTIKKVIKR